MVVAADPPDEPLWLVRYRAPHRNPDHLIRSALAAGGRVYVMGGCNPTPTTYSQVCAYTSDGTPLVNWGGLGSIYFGSMLATPSRVYIGGTLSFPGIGNN